jgi:hypothetical protein
VPESPRRLQAAGPGCPAAALGHQLTPSPTRINPAKLQLEINKSRIRAGAALIPIWLAQFWRFRRISGLIPAHFSLFLLISSYFSLFGLIPPKPVLLLAGGRLGGAAASRQTA